MILVMPYQKDRLNIGHYGYVFGGKDDVAMFSPGQQKIE